jgi:endonuclease YncB( thermonuclease family)
MTVSSQVIFESNSAVRAVGVARRWPVFVKSGRVVDLAEWLVRNGLALDWPTYSKGKYDGAQRDAEHAGRGIWQGSYVEPWLSCACIRQAGKPGDCSDDANSDP